MTNLLYEVFPDPIDKMLEEQKQSFSSLSGDFTITYSKAEEIRMGLYASQVSMLKERRDITKNLLGKSFWATIPRPFEPMSRDTTFAFIPTCPTHPDSRLIVINTSDLSKTFIDSPGFVSANEFSKEGNLLLLAGFTNVLLYNCDTRKELMLYTKTPDQRIEYAWFSDNGDNIYLIITDDHRTHRQRLLTLSLTGEIVETISIKTPDEIFCFDFDKYKRLAIDKYNLFNSHGCDFVAVGTVLNKWQFIDHYKDDKLIILRTFVPVSEIYHNKSKNTEGCDIRIKEIALGIL